MSERAQRVSHANGAGRGVPASSRVGESEGRSPSVDHDMHALLLERTRDLITTCPCASGCPSCVGPEGNTGPHAKRVALEILDRLLTAGAEPVPF